MDHTNGPISGMDSTSFRADSTSIFASTSAGAALPPLPSFESASGSVPAPDPASGTEMPGQAGLLERGIPRQSTNYLDGFAGNSAQAHSIEFRVARADSPVRRLRLTGNRYTFGSAEGCSIRLSDPSLRPMHAVLTRDRDRVVVRAYSVPIEVNHKQVTETTLVVGDRLQLGEYEFELLSISTMPETTPRSDLDPARLESASHGNPSANPNQSFDQHDADDTVWRHRLRQEIDQWRSKQVECDRRESLCDEREAHLRGRESELWSRAENLYRRESKIQDQESAVYQMHDDYAERQQELLRLREDTHNKQRVFKQRESEFARQEAEYRQKLEEATAHLLQSQAQATAATEAVQEMRQQFDALNEQIEELSSQQNDLKQNEKTERDENQRMRSELESQRDAAIDAQAEGEARRREALDRVEEMTVELELLRTQQSEGGEAESQKLLENEATIDSLRKQVEGLQETVDEASEEANRLRSDYRDALDSVRQLEHLVAQSNQRGDTDRDQWAADADSLRSEIESLSGDLERTREELDDLRQANQSLTTRLHEVETERDHAVQEISDRPTREAFDHLRNELETANQTLADLRQGLSENDDDQAHESYDNAQDDAITASGHSNLADASNLSVWNLPSPESGSDAAVVESPLDEVTVDEVTVDKVTVDDIAVGQVAAGQVAAEEPNAEAVVVDDPATPDEHVEASVDEETPELETPEIESPELESPDEVWPTYQVSEPIESNSEPEEIEAESSMEDFSSHAVDLNQEEDEEAKSSLSVWDLESADEQSEEMIENTGVWNPDPADESFSDPKSSTSDDSFPSLEASLDSSTDDDANRDEHEGVSSPWNHSPTDESDQEQEAVEGSLANLLIADLDSSDSDHDGTQPGAIYGQEAEEDSVNEDSVNEDSVESVASLDQASLLHEDPVSDGEAEEEVVGLMSLLQDDHHSDESNEDDSASSLSDGVVAWDREYPEESDSQPFSESISDGGSDSVWDIDQKEDSDNHSDCDQPSAHVDVTAMMPSIEELEDDEPVEAEPYADHHQQSDQVAAEPIGSELPEASPAPTKDANGEAETDDDSIEAYMNRLLGRVQGNPSEDDHSPAESVSLSASSISLESSPESTPENGPSPMAPQTEMDPDAPLVPRSQAPERNSDLSAMRDLANQSARNAISRSARIQTRNMQMAGVMNFGVAVVAVLFGLGATLLLSGGLLYLAWLMVVIIAVISIRDGLRNLADARTRLQAAERGELPEAISETIAGEEDQAAKAEDRLAQQNAAAQAVREQHQTE